MKNWVRNDAEGNSECITIPHQVRDDAEWEQIAILEFREKIGLAMKVKGEQ